MNYDAFKNWLDRYSAAWENRDMSIADTLFTADATYLVTPFEEPLHGYTAIIEYGRNVNPRQEDVQFEYTILAVTPELGIAHWKVNFIQHPDREKVYLDGIFVVRLNKENLCTEFKEWWHSHHEAV